MFGTKTRKIKRLTTLVEIQSIAVEQLIKGFNKATDNFNKAKEEVKQARFQRDWIAKVSEQKTNEIIRLNCELSKLKETNEMLEKEIDKSKTKSGK